MEDGIYFDIPLEEYLAIERLSKSGIKQIMISPADFWADSWLNPEPERLTPEQERRRNLSRLLGKAYHTARLEPWLFDEQYCREISQADFADDQSFLASGKDIEAQLAALGLPKKSKDDTDGVLSQAKRLAAAGYEGPIWHIEFERFEAQRGERIALSAEHFDQIKTDMSRVRSVEEIDQALSNGCPEVVILYTCPDTGLPMKSRLDFLRADGWVEFKSFANPNGKELGHCLIDAIRFSRYYIDVILYHEAVEAIRSQGLQPQGDATGGQREIVAQIQLATDPLPHRLIFQQKGRAPNVLSRELQLFEVPIASRMAALGSPTEAHAEHGDRETRRPTMLMQKGMAQIRNAKRTFQRYSEIYERGDPWLPWNPHEQLTDLEFGQHWLEVI